MVVVPVKTGQFNNRFIEIKDGLKEGDQVSLAPNIDENSETQGDRSRQQPSHRLDRIRVRRPGALEPWASPSFASFKSASKA